MNMLVENNSRVGFHVPFTINEEFLKRNLKDVLFVFGDNAKHFGKGGAAKLRDEPNTFGFVTKKYPSNADCSFYTLHDYPSIFEEEKQKLIKLIKNNPDKWILISRIGGGLANKYGIFERIISPWLETLEEYKNVILLY